MDSVAARHALPQGFRELNAIVAGVMVACFAAEWLKGVDLVGEVDARIDLKPLSVSHLRLGRTNALRTCSDTQPSLALIFPFNPVAEIAPRNQHNKRPVQSRARLFPSARPTARAPPEAHLVVLPSLLTPSYALVMQCRQ